MSERCDYWENYFGRRRRVVGPVVTAMDLETTFGTRPKDYAMESNTPGPMKKFYVGAKHIGRAAEQGANSSCQRETIEEAIEEAKRMIANGEVTSAVVVKIVAVVKKDYPPITVTMVD